jgi:hypothetical protein
MKRRRHARHVPALTAIAAAFATAYACANYETGGASNDGGAASDDAAPDGMGGDDATV